jgi:hypothetical protein
MARRHRVSVRIMGLTNRSYALNGGVVAFAVPQILGDHHVPEAVLQGWLPAVTFSPQLLGLPLQPRPGRSPANALRAGILREHCQQHHWHAPGRRHQINSMRRR